MAKNLNVILARMLKGYARDAEPEEIAEAVTAIDEITSEKETAEAVIPAEPVKDEAPDKLDLIIEKLDKLLNAKVEEEVKVDELPPEEPVVVDEEDPFKKLEDDLDELVKIKAEKEEEEDPIQPEEDEEEPESQFVDPEEINEESEEEEIVEEEEKPVADKKACDAARIALNAIKPVIAKLPAEERKKAADAAVAQIRKASGLDAQPKKNGYVTIRKNRRTIDRQAEIDIGKRIMEKRNPHYQK